MPPRRQRTLPRAAFQLIAGPGAARRDEACSPSGSGSIELRWNQSHGVAPVGASTLGLRGADVVEAVPFPAHEARLHVDLLDRRVDDRPVPRSLHRREVAADRVVRRDVGDVAGGDLEVVQVRLQAVAAGDPRDRLVVGVHDDVFALAEAEREHAPLPPRQVAPAFVCLLAQVLRRFAPRQLVEPDEPALRRVDQRPVLTRTGPVGREDVACRGIAIGHGDGQDRGLDAGQGVEALIVGGRGRRVGELRAAAVG